jgi:hypothetical protein
MKIDNFALIIGAMKCGTTSLFKYLAQHPQISACSKKETGFFCHDIYFSKGYDYYQNLWNWNPKIHEIALEASPGYTNFTAYLNAAENIKQIQKSTNSNFKFIYILRNPIERIESHYINGRIHRHKEALKPLSEGVNSVMIDLSKYAMQIDEYYQRFPANNILLLNFEDLKTNPLNVLKKVCQFLEIDPNYAFEDLEINHNSRQQLTRVMVPGYKLIRKTKLVKSIIKEIPDRTRENLHIFRNPFAKKEEHNIKLSQAQINYVLNELKDDIQKLNLEYGFDISSWQL